MKKQLWMAALMLALVGCGPKGNTQKESAETAAEAQVLDSLSAAQFVENVYNEVFALYKRSLNGKTTMPDVAALDHRFCSAAYLEQDSLIAVADEQSPEEMGFWDYDHWVQGQDWCDDLASRVDSVKEEQDKAMVFVTITNCSSQQQLALRIVNEGEKTLKIDDFIVFSEDGKSRSEREEMGLYLKQ